MAAVDGPSLIYSVTIDEEVVEEESKFVIVRLHGVAAVTNSPPPRTPACFFSKAVLLVVHVNRLSLSLSSFLAWWNAHPRKIRKFR